MRLTVLVTALLAAATTTTQADPGMWPLDRVPHEAIKTRHGVTLDDAWLTRARLSAANVGGASGSFVSAKGLVLTNHHVVRGCIDRLSTPNDDLAAKGFVAATQADERPCPGTTIRVLLSTEDVSRQVPADAVARKAAIAALEAPCTSADKQLRCEVVALYGGALHHLYKSAEYKDVRLVMAPEEQAASFGGDDDNFNFPRFAFDMALLRAYGPDGKPVQPKAWLKPTSQALKLHDPIFVPGHPGRTERLLTVAHLEALRDVQLPLDIAAAESEQATLHAYAKTSAEAQRQAADPLAGIENWLKAMRGQLPALRDPAVMAAKRTQETAVQAKASSKTAWEQAAQAAAALRKLYPSLRATEPTRRTLLDQALALAALHDEAQRPGAQQLDDYRGSRRARLEQSLSAKAPFYPALETARLAAFISRAQTQLGAEHPFVRALLGQGQFKQASEAAAHWVGNTELGSFEARARWLQADDGAWAKTADPLLKLAVQLQALRRPVLAAFEAEVTQLLRATAEPLAQARWAALGASEPPDATGTLRLSYGRVDEVMLGGLRQPWRTTLGGLFARADGFAHRAPHDLSPRIALLRDKLPASTPLNFIGTPDIIGGNSGSPVVNARGELVGLVFDGNLGSLPGRFLYDEAVNRMVAVHIDAIYLALEGIYGAPHLAREMKGQP